jgi:hypothetical protein
MGHHQQNQQQQAQEQQQQQQQNLEQAAFGFWEGIPEDLTGEVKEGGEVRRRETK